LLFFEAFAHDGNEASLALSLVPARTILFIPLNEEKLA
jgi:hypothetical protein